jgi:hypothetical protein
MKCAHRGLQKCLRLKYDAVLLVEFSRAKLKNDQIRIDNAIENRDVEIDEETVGGLNVRGVFKSNELLRSFVRPAFGVKSDRANALRKNEEFLTTRQTPLYSGVVNIGVNASRAGQQRHRHIDLFYGELIWLDVLRADSVKEQQQKENQEYQQR